MHSIGEKSLKKRWFGVTCEYQMEAMIGLLVRWDVESKPYTAHVYETNQTFTGSVIELLNAVNGVVVELFSSRFGGGESIRTPERKFVTQAYQGEESPLVDGFVILPTDGKIQAALNDGYKPNHWRNRVLNDTLTITNKSVKHCGLRI